MNDATSTLTSAQAAYSQAVSDDKLYADIVALRTSKSESIQAKQEDLESEKAKDPTSAAVTDLENEISVLKADVIRLSKPAEVSTI